MKQGLRASDRPGNSGNGLYLFDFRPNRAVHPGRFSSNHRSNDASSNDRPSCVAGFALRTESLVQYPGYHRSSGVVPFFRVIDQFEDAVAQRGFVLSQHNLNRILDT